MAELLSNSAHVHLLLNHVPTIGFGMGLVVFFCALAAKSDVLKRASLAIFFLVAVVAVATYVSGGAAEAVLAGVARPDFPPGVSPLAIRVHEDAALLAFIAMEVTGFFAWLALWHWRRVPKLPGWSLSTIVVLCLVTFGLMARAAELGGEISHAEIRSSGLRQADVIQSINGQPVVSADGMTALKAQLASAQPGSIATIGVVRDGKNLTVTIPLADAAAAAKRAERPDEAAMLGVRAVEPLTQELAAQFGVKINVEGLLIAQVHEQGPEGPADMGLARSVGLWVTGVTWVWPAAETLHFVGLCMLFAVVVIVDLRMLGMIRSVPYSAVYQMLPIGMIGFGLNLVTGILFFLGVPSQYVKNVMFFWKMLFVVLGGLNLLYFMLVDEAWAVGPGDDAPLSAKIAAASAIFIWVAVLFCGHMLPFIGNAF